MEVKQTKPASAADGSTASPPTPQSSESATKPVAAKAAPSSSSSSSMAGTKPKRRNNPRPELVELDIPIEKDTRYLRNGYDYKSKEQYVIDREHVKAALQEARRTIAIRVFDTDDVN